MANTKVQSEQIEDGSITADKLADGTIVAAELADNAVTTAKINADAVTGAKIADDAIDSEHYTDGSIDTAHIADAQITVAKMAANSVDSDQYVDGSIDTVHLGDLQVTTAKIANGNISTAKIADNAVTSAKIDTNIDIAGTFDVTGATTLDAGATIVGSGTGAGLYLNGTNSDSVAQGNFVRYGTNFLTQSNAANSDLITYAFNGSTFVNALNIKSNGNVGINCAGSNAKLEVVATSGEVFRADANSGAYRLFADQDGVKMNGNVGIGTTSPTNTLDLGTATQGRALTFTNYSNLFSEYSNASFWLASNFYGSAGASGYKTGATGNFGAAGVRVHGTGGGGNSGIIEFYTDTNASKTADAAFTPTKIMRMDNDGLKFGSDTAAANALDDYEEGSWSPQCDATGGNPNIGVTINYAKYIKVGGVVHISCYLSLNIINTGSGAARITNLPFPMTSGQGYTLANIGHANALATGTGGTTMYVTNGQSYMRGVDQTSTGNVGWSGTGNPLYIMMSATYNSV